MHYRIEERAESRFLINTANNLYVFEGYSDDVVLFVERPASFWFKNISKFYLNDKLILVSQLITKFFRHDEVSILEQYMDEPLSFSSDDVAHTLIVGDNTYQVPKLNCYANHDQMFLNGNVIATIRKPHDPHSIEFIAPNKLDINAAILCLMLRPPPSD